MTTQLCDVEALITFVSTEAGGRKTPAFSGYRPQIYYGGHNWDVLHQYGPQECILPGQTATVYLTFLSPEYHVGQVYPGKVFQVREGARIVAHGQVVELVNLIASASRMAEDAGKRYFKRYWPEDRGDSYASWGGATYYFVCGDDGYPDRQIEVYDNGILLSYDDVYYSDDYGMLTDKPLDLLDFASYEIQGDTFWTAVSATRPYNRPD